VAARLVRDMRRFGVVSCHSEGYLDVLDMVGGHILNILGHLD
jgi:hypothetical protein